MWHKLMLLGLVLKTGDKVHTVSAWTLNASGSENKKTEIKQ